MERRSDVDPTTVRRARPGAGVVAVGLVLGLGAAQASPVAAQRTDRDLRIGVVAGVGKSGFSGPDAAGWSSRTGVHAGITLFHALDDRFSLQLGLLYVQKGARREWGSAEVDLDYLEVPFLAGVRFNGTGAVSPRLVAGPAFALEAGEIGTALDGVDCVPYPVDPDCADPPGGVSDSSVDVGLLFGAGVDIRLDDRTFLGLGLAWELGTQSLEERVGAEVRNRTLLLQLGVGWRVGRGQRGGGPVVPPRHP